MFFNDLLAKADQLGPENICGEEADEKNHEQGHNHPEARDAKTVRDRNADLDQESREGRRERLVEGVEKKIEDKKSECDWQSDRDPSEENVADPALETFEHVGSLGKTRGKNKFSQRNNEPQGHHSASQKILGKSGQARVTANVNPCIIKRFVWKARGKGPKEFALNRAGITVKIEKSNY